MEFEHCGRYRAASCSVSASCFVSKLTTQLFLQPKLPVRFEVPTQCAVHYVSDSGIPTREHERVPYVAIVKCTEYECQLGTEFRRPPVIACRDQMEARKGQMK